MLPPVLEGAAQEVAIEAQAVGPALLRVELGGNEVVPRQHAGKPHAVFGLAEYGVMRQRCRVVAVHEVEVGAVLDPVEDGMRPDLDHAVPAHVWNLEVARREALDSAFDDVEARVLAPLFGNAKQRLLPHADAEKRPPGSDVLPDRLDEAGLP